LFSTGFSDSLLRVLSTLYSLLSKNYVVKECPLASVTVILPSSNVIVNAEFPKPSSNTSEFSLKEDLLALHRYSLPCVQMQGCDSS